MSWGYFLDLELTVPTKTWSTLGKTTGASLPAGWWGFQEAALERYFGSQGFESVTAQKALGFFKNGKSCVKSIDDVGGEMVVRLVAHLDRGGDTQVAGPIAAMFDAAAKAGGTGRIRLVNDGTYSGEDGVEVAIVDGKLARSAVEGSNDLVEELGAALYPDLAEIVERYGSPQPSPHLATPPKREAKPAKTKPAAKKSAAKKSAAKKPAAKRLEK
ncbi:MAG: hypothetical protein JST00_31530 [Deltaproteobacteria bacterium]|nr:hypothetical protein [Deltaproteobacteria bacterium]